MPPEFYGTASAKKAKREKALEALRKKRERRAGGLSRKSSLDNDYDDEGSGSPKVLTAIVMSSSDQYNWGDSFSVNDPAVLIELKNLYFSLSFKCPSNEIMFLMAIMHVLSRLFVPSVAV